MSNFEKFIKTIKYNFISYEYITFNIDSWNLVAILTNENFLYVINQMDNTLKTIDLENEDNVNLYDENFWEMAREGILKSRVQFNN